MMDVLSPKAPPPSPSRSSHLCGLPEGRGGKVVLSFCFYPRASSSTGRQTRRGSQDLQHILHPPHPQLGPVSGVRWRSALRSGGVD